MTSMQIIFNACISDNIEQKKTICSEMVLKLMVSEKKKFVRNLKLVFRPCPSNFSVLFLFFRLTKFSFYFSWIFANLIQKR